MSAPTRHDVPWTRRHDDPRRPLLDRVHTIAYPGDHDQLVELCRDTSPTLRRTAAGSHWALSSAAVADDVFIETRDPKRARPAMDRTLRTVVPAALHDDLLGAMTDEAWVSRHGVLVHIESGKRICDAYAELDQVDDPEDPASLSGWFIANRGLSPAQVEHLRGPWGFSTLGGAGGQTVVGAISTGTHGGDFDRGPVGDCVVAMHIVGDGGREIWVESTRSGLGQITDDARLREAYPGIEIIRDEEVLQAASLACGRLGVIYSALLRVERQYSLLERRELLTWRQVRDAIAVPGSWLFDASDPDAPGAPNRFLQIVVCLTPLDGYTARSQNLVGVTRRWQVPVDAYPGGPAERVGPRVVDSSTGRPRFELAGNSMAYSPDPDHPERSSNPSFLNRACSDASFLGGLIGATLDEVEEFVKSNGAIVGAGMRAASSTSAGVAALSLIPGLLIAILVLKALLDALGSDDRLGEYFNKVKDELLDPDEPDPDVRRAKRWVWQMIAARVFDDLQGALRFGARSYAVMDRHDYLNVSCERNVDSLEVFFDHADSRLTAYVDALIAFERRQQCRDGRAFMGYISLRFTGPSKATLGPQRHPRTCAVEVAGLADMDGSRQLLDHAALLARHMVTGGVVHWGQRNECSSADIERLFGGGPSSPLARWRRAAALVTAGSDRCSSAFTRRMGLEP